MSSILDQIDDTLDDWRGSNDAMHWAPDGGAVPDPDETLDSLTQSFASVPLLPLHDFPLDLTPAPLLRPGMVIRIASEADSQLLRVVRELDGGKWQVRPTTATRCLDARYHQRQKNRRKRR